jgi:AhpD family alkylhydroperoxidase
LNKRINIPELEPAGFKAMLGLEDYIRTCGLDDRHLELIKIRASQINGCAYCIDLHTSDALTKGMEARHIFLLDAWAEAEVFDEQEKLILAMTEEITMISKGGLTDHTYDNARRYFDDHYLAKIILAIVTINSWNRIAISTKKVPD